MSELQSCDHTATNKGINPITVANSLRMLNISGEGLRNLYTNDILNSPKLLEEWKSIYNAGGAIWDSSIVGIPIMNDCRDGTVAVDIFGGTTILYKKAKA